MRRLLASSQLDCLVTMKSARFSSLLLLLPLAAGQSSNSTSTSTTTASTSLPTTSYSPTSYLATETGPLTLPISKYPFNPFPTPSTPPDPPIYPATDPWYPPPVSPDPQIVPDFGPAWAAAHSKAQALVSCLSLSLDAQSCFNPTCAFPILVL